MSGKIQTDMVDFANRSNVGHIGDVAERLKAPHSKCGVGVTPPEVRILSSPLVQNTTVRWLFC